MHFIKRDGKIVDVDILSKFTHKHSGDDMFVVEDMDREIQVVGEVHSPKDRKTMELIMSLSQKRDALNLRIMGLYEKMNSDDS